MRRPCLDNLRWAIVLLVVVFHGVWCFRSWESTAGIPFDGIPALDGLGWFLYPWLMPCMFLLAGVSARYSLERRSPRQFLAQRGKTLLLPLAGSLIFLTPPLVSLYFHAIGGSVGGMFAYFPSPVLPLFFLAMMGLGPQWFLLELFLFSLLLLPLRRLGRGGRASPAAWLALPLCWLCFYAGSRWGNLGNRDLLNLLMLLLGFFLFAREDVQRLLERAAPALLAAVLALFAGILLLFRDSGGAYTTPAFLAHPLAVSFGACTSLAAVGGFRRWGGGAGRISRFLRARSFAVYLFHYLPMTALAWLAIRRALPPAAAYPLVLILPLAVSLLLYELLRRLPVLGALFGLKKFL